MDKINVTHTNEYGIPTHMEIPVSLIEEFSFIDSCEEQEEIISDFLSAQYGYCHNGFLYRIDIEKQKVFIFDVDWDIDDEEDEEPLTEISDIKGYPVHTGFMGWTGESYMLFATEEEYEEYLKGKED
jgi:hypothetical protein